MPVSKLLNKTLDYVGEVFGRYVGLLSVTSVSAWPEDLRDLKLAFSVSLAPLGVDREGRRGESQQCTNLHRSKTNDSLC